MFHTELKVGNSIEKMKKRWQKILPNLTPIYHAFLTNAFILYNLKTPENPLIGQTHSSNSSAKADNCLSVSVFDQFVGSLVFPGSILYSAIVSSLFKISNCPVFAVFVPKWVWGNRFFPIQFFVSKGYKTHKKVERERGNRAFPAHSALMPSFRNY